MKCLPFYLLREFTSIAIVTVYIPPCANAKEALKELHNAISEKQAAHPDAFLTASGDFKHVNLKTVLPTQDKFYQHIHFMTRGNNTLDKLYTILTRHHHSPTLAPLITSPSS